MGAAIFLEPQFLCILGQHQLSGFQDETKMPAKFCIVFLQNASRVTRDIAGTIPKFVQNVEKQKVHSYINHHQSKSNHDLLPKHHSIPSMATSKNMDFETHLLKESTIISTLRHMGSHPAVATNSSVQDRNLRNPRRIGRNSGC